MRIAELPFTERPLLELLHLDDEARREPDPDYAGFGFARAARVELSGDGGGVVDDALLVVIHSADDGEPLPDDVELEFVLGERSVTVLLSTFLDRWLPIVHGGERAIVLVMCNPHRAALAPAAPVPVHYALGDVESWLDDGEVRLVAETWRTA